MNVFKSATIKLTAWYLALMVGLSLAFSVVLYDSSSASLASGFEHQRMALRQKFLESLGFTPSPYDLDRLSNDEMTAAQQRLIANLTLANLGVLVVGGAASFYLARRTLRPIEQALDAQMRFTADASHELRTPLTAMQTEIEVALRDKHLPAAEARELLQSNLEEVRKLRDLSNGLLALANQDKEHFEPHPVHIAPVLTAVMEQMRALAAQRHITITNDAVDLVVLGDQERLTQLFVILLDNAIKYSPDKTTITIRSQVKNTTGHVVVEDQGYGIKPADLPHIFDRLFRADSSRSKDSQSGYGIGLSIAKKIVQLHKGAIDVTSRVNKGSTFTVRLPLATKTK